MSDSKVTVENLNANMEFYHIIRVDASGNVTDSPDRTYTEGWVSMYLVNVETYHWEDDFNLPEGWSLMDGYSGQHGYSGPVMHSSEFIGGGMARTILETPGDYVALPVESDCGYKMDNCDPEIGCDCEPAGWVVAFKPAE